MHCIVTNLISLLTVRRDVGAATCGGTFVVAGGTSGKSGLNSIDVFNASSTTGGSPMAVYTMEVERSPLLGP